MIQLAESSQVQGAVVSPGSERNRENPEKDFLSVTRVLSPGRLTFGVRSRLRGPSAHRTLGTKARVPLLELTDRRKNASKVPPTRSSVTVMAGDERSYKG